MFCVGRRQGSCAILAGGGASHDVVVGEGSEWTAASERMRVVDLRLRIIRCEDGWWMSRVGCVVYVCRPSEVDVCREKWRQSRWFERI